jgi:hypothetical protein
LLVVTTAEVDPVKAIEDALREFPADGVLIIARPDDDASWLEEGSGETAQTRFRLPVSVATVGDDGSITPRALAPSRPRALGPKVRS